MSDIIWVEAGHGIPYASAVREDFSDADPEALVGCIATMDDYGWQQFHDTFEPLLGDGTYDAVAWVITNAEQYEDVSDEELVSQDRMRAFDDEAEARHWVESILNGGSGYQPVMF